MTVTADELIEHCRRELARFQVPKDASLAERAAQGCDRIRTPFVSRERLHPSTGRS